MKQLIVSPRTESVQFGADSIGFNEFVKYSNGVLSVTDGTEINLDIDLGTVLPNISDIDGKLAYNGIVIDTDTNITLSPTLQGLSSDEQGRLIFNGTIVGNTTVETIATDDGFTVLGSALRTYVPAQEEILGFVTEKTGTIGDFTASTTVTSGSTITKYELTASSTDGVVTGDVLVNGVVQTLTDGTVTVTDVETITPENISFDYTSADGTADTPIGTKVLVVDGSNGGGTVGNVYEKINNSYTAQSLNTLNYGDTGNWLDLGVYIPETTISSPLNETSLEISISAGSNITAIDYVTYNTQVTQEAVAESETFNEVTVTQDAGQGKWTKFDATVVGGTETTVIEYSVDGGTTWEVYAGTVECNTDSLMFRVNEAVTQIDVTNVEVGGKFTLDMMAKALYDMIKGNSSSADVESFVAEFEKVYGI